MRYCIYFSFDRQTDLALQRVQQLLAARAPEYGMSGKLGPHLSLLVFDDSDQNSVLTRFDRLAAGVSGFSMPLNGIGFFTGRRSVVFVEPLPSDALNVSYRLGLEIFSGSAIVPQYRGLDVWKPHITLAKGRNEYVLPAIKALAEQEWLSRPADICGIGLINVQKPLESLASTSLM